MFTAKEKQEYFPTLTTPWNYLNRNIISIENYIHAAKTTDTPIREEPKYYISQYDRWFNPTDGIFYHATLEEISLIGIIAHLLTKAGVQWQSITLYQSVNDTEEWRDGIDNVSIKVDVE